MSEMLPVVIVGGGLVGGLCGLLLAQAGVQVTVLDAAAPLNEQDVLPQVDARVWALSSASIHLLQQAGVWSRIARHMPYSGMQVWNRDGYADICFGQASTHEPHAEQWLGSMVEPSIVQLALQAHLQQHIADYRSNVKVTAIEPLNQGWRIQLANGQSMTTALVIAADGANSWVRQQAMIAQDELDYRETAISCAVRTSQAHEHVARQVFLPTGPLAFLPTTSLDPEQAGHWQSIVWTLPQDHADELSAFSDQDFCQHLTAQSLHALGEVLDVKSRAKFNLKARAAQQYVKAGLALVGDAAHSIHPLAGQGVNIGCLDAAVLADVLLHDLERGLERGVWAHESTLRRYEHLRKGHNDAMMHSMSAMSAVQKSPFSMLRWARNVGLKQVDQQQALKQLFLQQASGINSLHNTRYRCV